MIRRTLAARFAALVLASCDQGAGGTEGQQAFEASCGGCHAPGHLPRPNWDLDDPRQRAELDAFLARHHAPDPATRDTIIDYMAARSR